MITRTFLFLLALVTGISAANAASGVRAAPSEIGSSAAVSVALINGITRECGEPLYAATCVFCEEPAGLAAAAQLVKRAIFNSAPTCTCTYRSDRARE